MAEHQSALPPAAWKTLQALDPLADDEPVTLATCLALSEHRFQQLFSQALRRLGELESEDLPSEADALADAHHALTLLQDSLHATSRRMLEVLDRVSRELGE